MNSIKSSMFIVFCLGVFINQAFAQVPSYVPSNGLVGWWPFTGNANDESGNANNGTVNGATLTSDRFGQANKAYSFNGTSSYIEVLHNSSQNLSNAVSFSLWINPPDYSTNNNQTRVPLGKKRTNTSGIGFETVDVIGSCCGPQFFTNNNAGSGGLDYEDATPLSTLSWTHLVGTYDGSTLKLYKNSVLLGSASGVLNLSSTIQNLYFGREGSNAPSNYFKGFIDDIGFWNRALTQQEITNLYNANNGPQATISTANNSICAGQSATLTATVANSGTSCNTAGLPPSLLNGLVGYWPFCGNANDASGNGNNGTVNGATFTTDRFGVANSAYSFDGVNDNIRVNNNALFSFLLNSSFTTNLWFSVQVVPNSTKFLIGQGDGDAQHQNRLWGSYVNQSELRNWFRGNVESNQVWNISPLPSTNVWKMISMVRDYNNTIKMYVDGQLVDTDVDIAGFASPFTQIRDIYFGALYDAYNSQLQAFFNGKLDDIGIWNRALSAQEVSQLYNAGQPTYAWSNGATTPVITVTPAQTTAYTCTVTMNGASTTQSQTITVNALPNVSAGQNQTVCVGTAVTLSGSGASSYSWNNGVNNGVAFTPASTQTYTVTGTDGNGCVNTAQTTVTVNALPMVGAGTNQTVCAGTSVTLSGSGAGTYTWNNGVTNGVSFTPNNSQTYTVTGTDANGCTNTAQTTVTVNALPMVGAGTNQTVCAGTSVTLSGSGASTYTWNNGVTNGVSFTPNNTQTYTVTGTDGNGCANTAQVTITVNTPPTVSAGSTQTVCVGTPVTLSGSGASSYTWNNNVQNGVPFTPLSTQTYIVTGTAANGCTNTSQVQVIVNALPAVTAGQNQSICIGSPITLNGSGAQSYVWNNGVLNGVAFTPNTSQNYTVIGTNANGCQNSAQVQVTVNPLPTVSAGLPIAVCSGANVVLFGSGAQSYTWSNGIQNAIPFIPGSTQVYTVTGTDANGCTDTDQILVTVNSYPQVSAGQNQTVCAGDSVTLTASGAPSYSWSNGIVNGVSFVPASTTTYSVIGNSNGCLDTAQVTVTVNALPSVSAGTNQTVCAGTAVTLSGSGATSYTWNNGVINGVSFTPNNTQTYTVTGTDANGCANTAQTTVTVNALPMVGAGANQTVCPGTAVTLSGSGASTYTWNNGVINGVSFTPNNTQTYTVTGTDGNGCANTAQVLVTVANPSSSTITETACLSYTLNGQNYTQSGTYEQNLTNVLGCDSTLTLNLTILPLPNLPNIYIALNNVLSTDAQPNTFYQWINCTSGLPIANATDTFYTATINGVYAVEASNSCGTVSSDCITISNSSIYEYVDQLKLFPNPTKDFLFIDGLKESAINFELRDVTGRLILMGTLDASNNSLDMNPFSEGNYRLVLEDYGVFSLVKY